MKTILPIIRQGNKYLIHVILCLFLCCGCWSLSTFQSPVVLEKGENSAGLGFTGYIDQDEGQLNFYQVDFFLEEVYSKILKVASRFLDFRVLVGVFKVI